MSKILEILDSMIGQLRTEAITALDTNDKKKAIKILKGINKLLPKHLQNELLE